MNENTLNSHISHKPSKFFHKNNSNSQSIHAQDSNPASDLPLYKPETLIMFKSQFENDNEKDKALEQKIKMQH
jgi:hypothetical protein